MHEVLAVVLFSVGGWRAGVEARQVRGLRPTAAGTPEGELAAALGLLPTAGSPVAGQCLTLKRAGQDKDKEIRVDSPVDLVSLPVAAIHPLPPLLAARSRLSGLRALAIRLDQGEKSLALLFDADMF